MMYANWKSIGGHFLVQFLPFWSTFDCYRCVKLSKLIWVDWEMQQKIGGNFIFFLQFLSFWSKCDCTIMHLLCTWSQQPHHANSCISHTPKSCTNKQFIPLNFKSHTHLINHKVWHYMSQIGETNKQYNILGSSH